MVSHDRIDDDKRLLRLQFPDHVHDDLDLCLRAEKSCRHRIEGETEFLPLVSVGCHFFRVIIEEIHRKFRVVRENRCRYRTALMAHDR